jgi:hypothetical protein
MKEIFQFYKIEFEGYRLKNMNILTLLLLTGYEMYPGMQFSSTVLAGMG